MFKYKIPKTPSTVEEAEKTGQLYIACGNVKWYSCSGSSIAVSY